MARGQADGSWRIAALAARTLEALYVAACGEPPRGARAWRDGSTLLLVLRPGEHGAAVLECERLPALIAQAVRARSGAELRDGRWRSEPELGIEIFVFGLPACGRVRGDAAAPRRAPTWRRWSPVPSREPSPGGRPGSSPLR